MTTTRYQFFEYSEYMNVNKTDFKKVSFSYLFNIFFLKYLIHFQVSIFFLSESYILVTAITSDLIDD